MSFRSILLATCLCLALFPALSAQVNLSDKEKAWLANNEKVLVGGSLDWTPFNFVNSQGQYQGIANDYLELISKNTDLKFELVIDTWQANLQRIRRNEIHILPAVYKTPARETFLNFSTPYFEALDYFFVHQDINVETFADLDGKRLAIPKDYAHREIIKEHFPKIIMVDAQTFGGAIDLVLQREADILFDTYGALIYTLEEEGINTIKPFKSTRHLGKNPIHIVSSKQHPELASIIQKGLDAISPLEHRNIHNKWFKTKTIEDLASERDGLYIDSLQQGEQFLNNPLQLTEEEKIWIKHHPVINVAGDYAWAPFEFSNEQGLHDGLGHDLLLAIAKLTGLQFHFSTNVWETSLAEVENKEKDLLVATFKTKEREQNLLFSNAYISLLNYFFIRTDSRVNTIDDLSGKRIAIIRDSAKEDEIKRLLPNITMVYVESPEEAITTLLENDADILYDSHAVINYILNAKNITSIKAFKTLPNSPINSLHIAVRNDYSQLISILNKALLSLETNGLQPILDKWLVDYSLERVKRVVPLTPGEKAWLNQNNKFTIVGDPNWMPFEALDADAQYVGIIHDYLAIVADTLNITFEPIQTENWQQSKEKVFSQKADIVSAFPNYKNFDSMSFSNSYINTPIVFVMQNENKYINSIEQIINKRISLLKDYPSTKDIIRRFPNKEFTFVDTPAKGLEELSSGKTDVFISSLAQANYYIAEQGYSGLRIVGKTDYTLEVSFAVQPQHAPLVPLLNKVLNSISTAEKQQVLDRWGSKDLIIKTDYKLVGIVVLIAALIIIVIFIWNKQLQKQIELRTKTELSLKQSERNLSVVINNIPVIVYVVDINSNRLLMANSNAIDELELDESNINQISASQFYNGNIEDIYEQQVQITTTEKRIIDGLLSVIPIRYQGKTALLHIVVNLNDRIVMERALEQEKDKAESANKAKSEFLANMSHEIRTPMNAIIGFTELLHEQIQDNKLKSFVQTIKSAGNSLLLLINDILDLSKIEAGKLTISKEVHNPHDIFDDISKIFTMNVRSKQLDFMLEIDERIPSALLLDSTRIRQILFNLVGNAVKFTDKGVITLTATALNEDKIHSKVDLRIDVQDTGIGISEDKLSHIFESFQQQEGQSVRKYGGTGLGLTISRRLTELMDGELSVTSKLGVGSCFSVYLRSIDVAAIKDVKSTSKDTEEVSNVKFKNTRVLIVDDILDNRKLLIEIFRTLSIEFMEASNGLEAVKLAESSDFDLIIMDIRMPEMDGYQAANIIKKSKPTLPIIALTASVMRDDYELMRRENFAGYLRKPVLKQELISELKNHLPYEKESLQQEEKAVVQQISDSLRILLADHYMSQCEQLKLNNNLSDIANFAQNLSQLAQEHNSEQLHDYSTRLIEATDIFDIVAIKALLNEFSNLSDR
ncbi:transporter substrate-binding domain-containing protein [Thalassotalea sp. M1531]|uniref:histidine kinase n=1 Tax=Thalassotalea algicola TaxID=2716224 RepID=A0A7Y0LD10_9GAMM|nr:transporter substrate-binding domain-containing protein [Thalassotalea algicola]NMP31919.1 transporter substrate-binding domain-containing protein [Thalassotalea algicola]